PCRGRRVSNRLAVEAPPVLVELTAQLADPALAEPVPGSQLLRRVVQRHVFSDPAISVSQLGEPDGVIDPEGCLLLRRGDRVVAQPLLESVLIPLPAGHLADRRGQQTLNVETSPPLCGVRQDVPGALLAAEPPAGADGPDGEGGQGGGEPGGVPAPL